MFIRVCLVFETCIAKRKKNHGVQERWFKRFLYSNVLNSTICLDWVSRFWSWKIMNLNMLLVYWYQPMWFIIFHFMPFSILFLDLILMPPSPSLLYNRQLGTLCGPLVSDVMKRLHAMSPLGVRRQCSFWRVVWRWRSMSCCGGTLVILDVLALVFRSTLIWESSKLICPWNFIYAFL